MIESEADAKDVFEKLTIASFWETFREHALPGCLRNEPVMDLMRMTFYAGWHISMTAANHLNLADLSPELQKVISTYWQKECGEMARRMREMPR